MSRGKRLMIVAVVAPLGIALVGFIGGTLVQQLWNWLLPSLFGWREVTFWQALGLLALCRILFGGFGFRPRGGRHMGRRTGEHWAAMTPEEREKFKQGMRGRWGFRASEEDEDISESKA